MLMSPNEDKTAVHGCHYRADMAVSMPKVLAIPRIGTCASVIILVLCQVSSVERDGSLEKLWGRGVGFFLARWNISFFSDRLSTNFVFERNPL